MSVEGGLAPDQPSIFLSTVFEGDQAYGSRTLGIAL